MTSAWLDTGPKVGGSGARANAMQSQILWVLMLGVAWLQLVQVVREGKQWLCLAVMSADCCSGDRFGVWCRMGRELWVRGAVWGGRLFVFAQSLYCEI